MKRGAFLAIGDKDCQKVINFMNKRSESVATISRGVLFF